MPTRANGDTMQAPIVERIAGWSARHRKTAAGGWLVLVAAVFVGGSMITSTKVQQYDAGQSGQAERALNRLNVKFPPAENVLIQARSPGATFARDPELRNATAQVVAALRARPGSAADIRSPLTPGGQALISASGTSALVRFNVPGTRTTRTRP